jgi:integrase
VLHEAASHSNLNMRTQTGGAGPELPGGRYQKIRLQIHQGKYGRPAGSKTLNEFVENSYKPWAKANKKSWKIDMSRLKPILAFFGKKKLSEISPFLIEKYKIERKATPVVSKNKSKPRSLAAVNRELRLLSRIFRLATANKEVGESPCREVAILKGEQPRTRYLAPDEETRLMATLVGERSHLHSMATLAINTGLRANELFSLKVSDIDFHRDVLHIKHTKTDDDREVPLNDTARELLRGWFWPTEMAASFSSRIRRRERSTRQSRQVGLLRAGTPVSLIFDFMTCVTHSERGRQMQEFRCRLSET